MAMKRKQTRKSTKPEAKRKLERGEGGREEELR